MRIRKDESKRKWELKDKGDGITYYDVIQLLCGMKIIQISDVQYIVLKSAGISDAEKFKPSEEL